MKGRRTSLALATVTLIVTIAAADARTCDNGRVEVRLWDNIRTSCCLPGQTFDDAHDRCVGESKGCARGWWLRPGGLRCTGGACAAPAPDGVHCCWPGQQWRDGKCAGVAECPPGHRYEGELAPDQPRLLRLAPHGCVVMQRIQFDSSDERGPYTVRIGDEKPCRTPCTVDAPSRWYPQKLEVESGTDRMAELLLVTDDVVRGTVVGRRRDPWSTGIGAVFSALGLTLWQLSGLTFSNAVVLDNNELCNAYCRSLTKGFWGTTFLVVGAASIALGTYLVANGIRVRPTKVVWTNINATP